MIRKLQKTDMDQVMDIWLKGNTDSHPFISKDYWVSNIPTVRQQILQADVLVFEEGGAIQGFIGIVENYIAGIFVGSNYRSHGIGRQLLDTAKEKYSELSLSVYQKNRRARDFYLREGFHVESENIDEATDEIEYTMVWRARPIS